MIIMVFRLKNQFSLFKKPLHNLTAYMVRQKLYKFINDLPFYGLPILRDFLKIWLLLCYGFYKGFPLTKNEIYKPLELL